MEPRSLDEEKEKDESQCDCGPSHNEDFRVGDPVETIFEHLSDADELRFYKEGLVKRNFNYVKEISVLSKMRPSKLTKCQLKNLIRELFETMNIEMALFYFEYYCKKYAY